MLKLTIKITKEVLEKTKRCNSDQITSNCAIAYAVRRLFPRALVGCGTIDFGMNVLTFCDLPQSAIDFITEFDSSQPEQRLLLPELSFTIEVPDSVIDSIGIEQAKEIIENSDTLELA